jgi:hypothetical protein
LISLSPFSLIAFPFFFLSLFRILVIHHPEQNNNRKETQQRTNHTHTLFLPLSLTLSLPLIKTKSMDDLSASNPHSVAAASVAAASSSAVSDVSQFYWRIFFDFTIVLCTQMVFFSIGWIFFYRKLFQDYEVSEERREEEEEKEGEVSLF